jgi:hypothetical protein
MPAPDCGGARRESRVLVVIDQGFNGASVTEVLQREHHEIQLCRPADALADDGCDLILLCTNGAGAQDGDLLDRLTASHPNVPVIVVTEPAPSEPHRVTSPAAPAFPDAPLLLRSVRDALRTPRVKRLIRVPGRAGGTQFAARNARWLSDELQSRYGTPFEFAPPPLSIPVHFDNAPATAI